MQRRPEHVTNDQRGYPPPFADDKHLTTPTLGADRGRSPLLGDDFAQLRPNSASVQCFHECRRLQRSPCIHHQRVRDQGGDARDPGSSGCPLQAALSGSAR